MGSRFASTMASLLFMATVLESAIAQLSTNHYAASCPGGKAKVAEVVNTWIDNDRTLAPSLLRMHFHDCFVRGCEASVLLDVPNGEKFAFGNRNSLRGFEVIDDIKAELEALCPGVFSCADIIALAARDAMVAFGVPGLNWNVPLGRRDGNVSSAAEANSNLPPPSANFDSLKNLFAGKGFNVRELVVLSGSHTIGVAHCRTIQSRLYNFSSTEATDPALRKAFARSLKRQCPFGDTTTVIKMDQSTIIDKWNREYFENVLDGKGLFISDNALLTTFQGRHIVDEMEEHDSPFTPEFAAAMSKMSQIGVLTGSQGQIRANCRLVN
ncbi:peroxidase [Marchantia polymorpha subsp. ruderalis]|uniref:Peroxidase n=2 Tax=Marchantia polymorpha TaxID=3197 RepID=A0AAF6BJ84_MARPO|nr:hypothetical protein MARPO_0196s0015 [Marchantia polymorpha]BBN12068.1 hypothetical protein Mp_5g17090 [Marchantia polymorpha subsp. ruderalis]|eukprot:PTQ27505.1 hypothetical protein MARPO_0196s0015 [Marchantia polymorpha]